jgi:16S rRNA processing protein RimM
MKKKDLVYVGIFGQPQGLKGNIKLNIFTSSFESFKSLNKYFLEKEDKELFFTSFSNVGKRYICSLAGCENRDEANAFNGKKIFSLRKNFPEIDKNEYYILDLIGCKVIILGHVVDVKNFGAGDLLEIQNTEKKIFHIPMNNENLSKVEIEKKIITVDPLKGLLD